ncbi:hypothetical protein [Nocardia sp. NPDC052566]|uniref:hypothetical protein n=1 Tax=Nocardia sp. NPDC052566 TaxID=3364330 RepID=UPI0037CC504A
MTTKDEFDLDVRVGIARKNWSLIALDPPTDTDSHEATCGSACTGWCPDRG